MIYYYIYLKNNSVIYYKITSHDNFLSVGDYNSYGHKLLFKACVIGDNIHFIE